MAVIILARVWLGYERNTCAREVADRSRRRLNIGWRCPGLWRHERVPPFWGVLMPSSSGLSSVFLYCLALKRRHYSPSKCCELLVWRHSVASEKTPVINRASVRAWEVLHVRTHTRWRSLDTYRRFICELLIASGRGCYLFRLWTVNILGCAGPSAAAQITKCEIFRMPNPTQAGLRESCRGWDVLWGVRAAVILSTGGKQKIYCAESLHTLPARPSGRVRQNTGQILALTRIVCKNFTPYRAVNTLFRL
jgi:hypothetical protein